MTENQIHDELDATVMHLLTLSLHPFLLFIYWLNEQPESPAILAYHLLVDPGRHAMLTQLETPYAIVNPG